MMRAAVWVPLFDELADLKTVGLNRRTHTALFLPFGEAPRACADLRLCP